MEYRLFLEAYLTHPQLLSLGGQRRGVSTSAQDGRRTLEAICELIRSSPQLRPPLNRNDSSGLRRPRLPGMAREHNIAVGVNGLTFDLVGRVYSFTVLLLVGIFR